MSPTVRTLSVIDLAGNPGGGARFVRALLPALRRVRPELEITFYGTPTSLGRDDFAGILASSGVRTHEIQWHPAMRWKSLPLALRLSYKARRRLRMEPDVLTYIQRNMAREITTAGELTYYPWPYHMPVPTSGTPMVATMHDLNFKYFFGAPIVGPDAVRALDADTPEWLSRAKIVTSSQFMASELARFYPDTGADIPVVRLAPFVRPDRPAQSNERLAATIGGGRFMLCPTQVTVHKNLGVLIAAQAILRDRYPDLRLIVTGMGSEMATGRASAIGSVRGDPNPDVVGLGYVSNDEIDWLIDHATVVVNASLYEAGNGPGVDAWVQGTPVAMSDIPSFREHVDVGGLDAALFDPRDPADAAAKVGEILDNPEQWASRAAHSQSVIRSRTWDDVAADYLAVFDAAVTRGSDG